MLLRAGALEPGCPGRSPDGELEGNRPAPCSLAGYAPKMVLNVSLHDPESVKRAVFA